MCIVFVFCEITAILEWSPYWNIRHFGFVAILEYPPFWIRCYIEFTIILQFSIEFNAIKSFLVGQCCIPDLFRLTVNYVCFAMMLVLYCAVRTLRFYQDLS